MRCRCSHLHPGVLDGNQAPKPAAEPAPPAQEHAGDHSPTQEDAGNHANGVQSGVAGAVERAEHKDVERRQHCVRAGDGHLQTPVEGAGSKDKGVERWQHCVRAGDRHRRTQ
eukprot:364695-Chlamydomonas_euryale.AAC.2